MNTNMKYSKKEAFKSAFKIFGQNFFVVFFLSVFSYIFVHILLVPILASTGIIDSFTTENLNVFVALGTLSARYHLLFQCVSFISLNLVSFLLVSAFLPAFRGSKIKFRNYFPNFKKVLKALLATILSAAIPLVISIFFADFLVKNGGLFDMLVFILRGMLVFFYIEIVRGESIVQSFRNIQEPLSKTIPFYILLGFINFVVCVIPILVPLIAESDTLLNLTLTIEQFLVILPFSTLALIDAYTQLSPPKSNT